MKAWRVLVLVAAVLPAAWVGWQYRDMPQLGLYHDDAIYLVTAKTWAETGEYKIGSLPGTPWQTKYPPLYPAVLAGVWKVAPEFPENLPWLAGVCWLFLPLSVWMLWRSLGAGGLEEGKRWWATLFFAFSPIPALFATVTMSELPFLCLLWATLVALEGARTPREAALAGLVAGVTFLSRSTTLALLVSAPAVFLLARQWRLAGAFAGAMAPFVAAWMGWAARHREAGDAMMLYYTDYFGFYRADMRQADWGTLLWMNFDSAWQSMAAMVLMWQPEDLLSLSVGRVLSLMAVVGVVRLVRAGKLRHYAACGAVYLVQLLIWDFPPDTRFLLPLLGLLAAGFVEELSRLGEAIGKNLASRKAADRMVARGMQAAGLALGAWVVVNSLTMTLKRMPKGYDEQRAVLQEQGERYRWLREEAPEGTRVYSYRDAITYLYTGRPSVSLMAPPATILAGGKAAAERVFGELPELCRKYGLTHVEATRVDFHLHAKEVTLEPHGKAMAACGLKALP